MFVFESKYFKNGDKVRIKSEYYDDPAYARYFANPFGMSRTIDYKNVIFTVDMIDTRDDDILIRGGPGEVGGWVPCWTIEKVRKVFNGLEV